MTKSVVFEAWRFPFSNTKIALRYFEDISLAKTSMNGLDTGKDDLLQMEAAFKGVILTSATILTSCFNTLVGIY